MAKIKVCKLKPEAISFNYCSPVLTSQLAETGKSTAAKLRSVIFLQDHSQVESESESEQSLNVISEEQEDSKEDSKEESSPEDAKKLDTEIRLTTETSGFKNVHQNLSPSQKIIDLKKLSINNINLDFHSHQPTLKPKKSEIVEMHRLRYEKYRSKQKKVEAFYLDDN